MTGVAVDLMDDIPRAVSEYWQDFGCPVLLSVLGGRLSPEARAELRIINKTLGKYIREHLADRVRFFVIPTKGDAAAPVLETIGISELDLSRRYQNNVRSRTVVANPRFHPDVWAAFSRPLQEVKRYLNVAEGRRPHLNEIALSDEARPDWLEVTLSDLPDVQLGPGVEPGPVANAIRAWASKHQIDIDLLYVPSRSEVAPSIPQGVGRSTPSIVDTLSLLEPHELARINIPADVVLSLIQRISGKK
jgi:hypothetical protein